MMNPTHSESIPNLELSLFALENPNPKSSDFLGNLGALPTSSSDGVTNGEKFQPLEELAICKEARLIRARGPLPMMHDTEACWKAVKEIEEWRRGEERKERRRSAVVEKVAAMFTEIYYPSVLLLPPKFDFNNPKTPFYTSPRFLPPSKVERCRIVDAIISHGCFLGDCSVEHSIVGVRLRLDNGVELKDTMMMGADYYQTESEIASTLAQGKVPVGVGHNTKISDCIIDKNAKIGRDVIIANKDGVEKADRAEKGFYIRSGITVVLKNATIKDGTVI